MAHEYPKNPMTPVALRVDQITSGLNFHVYRDGHIAERGTFLTSPEYDNEGWFGIIAQIDSGEVSIDPYDVGIICDSEGRWRPDTFTVEDDSNQW
jgi:hypothetical protein